MDNQEFKILLLEDFDADAELVERELKKIRFPYVTKRVEDGESYRKALAEFQPDLILSDYSLASYDGMSALDTANQSCPRTLFIFVSGSIGEDRAIDALKSGARDYVLKDRLNRLVPAVERALEDIKQRTARERIQEELKESQEWFKAFMDHTPAVAFLKNKEGQYIYTNKPFEKWFNLAKSDLVGKNDFDLLPKEIAEHNAENDKETLESNRKVQVIERVPSSDGKDRTWLMYKFPINSRKSVLIGGIAIDITEQKTLETELKNVIGELARVNAELDRKNHELKKLDKLKSDFVSTVSHELRTPMTIIKESISQIMDKLCGETTPLQEKRLSMTLRNIDRLKHIVDNLLDISKLESKKMELEITQVDINDLIKEVVFSFEPQAKTKGLELRYNSAVESIVIDADKYKIVQILINLIGNAVKFTEQGWIEVAVFDRGDVIECRVSDSGRGIKEEEMSRVFNKFEQFGRQEGPGERGTGLGLAICKEIVTLHKGSIRVESKVDVGSSFIFTIPKGFANKKV